MIKCLATADWHVDNKNINELEKCLDFLVGTAKTETVDIVIHCGDVFNSRNVQLDSKAAKLVFRIFSELANIAPVIAILGTPSHDGSATEVLAHINARYPVHVSSRPEQIYLCEGDIKNDPAKLSAPDQAPIEAVISLCPAPTKQFWEYNRSAIKTSDVDIASEMSKMFMGFAAQAEPHENAPHVLVGHWNITGSLISETQTLTGVDIELSLDQMAMASADVNLVGHIHKAQKLGSKTFYAGSITGLNWGELDEKGFYIHDFIGKSLVESRFIKTPSRKLLKVSEDFTGVIDITDLVALPWLRQKEVEDANVKIELKVYQDEAQKANIEDLKTDILRKGANNVEVKLIRVPRENIRSEKLLKLTCLGEKLVEMAALKQETVPGSILEKADMLESEEPDKIIQQTAGRI